MSRKWALGLAVIVVALAGLTAGAVFGGGSPSSLPEYATVEVELEPVASPAGLSAAKPKKPRVLYLQGEASTVDVDSTGPYVDVGLSSCPGNSRVIDGGVVADSTDVYQQGAYVATRTEYHVRLGFDDDANPADFRISSHLICLKGVK